MPNYKNIYIAFSGLAIIALGYLFYPSAITLDKRWDTNHESYSHGYILLAVAILLALRQWKEIKGLALKPHPPSFIALALCCLAWLSAHIANIQVGEQLMLPAIVLSTIYLLAGKQIGSKLAFPVLVIYTVIPVWDVLNPALQYLTATVSSELLQVFGIAVYIDGNNISIPAGHFVVASGCSGLNYLLMCVFLSLVYGHLYIASLKKKLLMVIAGVVTGIICNWVRVTAIIVIGQLSNMESSIIKDHENLGLVVFFLFTLPLMFLGRSLSASAPNAQPANHESPSIKPTWYLWPATVVITATLTHNWAPDEIIKFDKNDTQKQVASTFEQLNLTPSAQPAWGPDISNADLSFDLALKLIDNHAKVSIRTFLSETQGKELIHESNHLYLKSKWRATEQSTQKTPAGLSVSVVNLTKGRSKETTQLIYWYQAGDTQTPSTDQVKLLQIQQGFLRNPEVSVIAISRVCESLCSNNNTQLMTLADDIHDLYRKNIKEILAAHRLP